MATARKRSGNLGRSTLSPEEKLVEGVRLKLRPAHWRRLDERAAAEGVHRAVLLRRIVTEGLGA